MLVALVGDDPATLREFLLDFGASAKSIAAELSAARSVGALALGQLCAELEAAGKAGRGAELGQARL